MIGLALAVVFPVAAWKWTTRGSHWYGSAAVVACKRPARSQWRRLLVVVVHYDHQLQRRYRSFVFVFCMRTRCINMCIDFRKFGPHPRSQPAIQPAPCMHDLAHRVRQAMLVYMGQILGIAKKKPKRTQVSSLIHVDNVDNQVDLSRCILIVDACLSNMFSCEPVRH